MSNTGEVKEEGDRRQKVFRSIIRQRFNQQQEEEEEEERQAEESFSEDEEEDEEEEGMEDEVERVHEAPPQIRVQQISNDVLNIRGESDEEADDDMEDEEEIKSCEDHD